MRTTGGPGDSAADGGTDGARGTGGISGADGGAGRTSSHGGMGSASRTGGTSGAQHPGRAARGTSGTSAASRGVRWLDDEEQATWRAFLGASQRVREALDRQLQRDAGMPHAYYLILAMLSEADRRTLTMTELARRTRSSPSRLSHAVAKLEAKGWVRRGRHSGDHRTTLATLTDAGLEELEGTAPGHVEQARKALFDHLTREQVEQLHAICRAVLDGSEDGPLPQG